MSLKIDHLMSKEMDEINMVDLHTGKVSSDELLSTILIILKRSILMT